MSQSVIDKYGAKSPSAPTVNDTIQLSESGKPVFDIWLELVTGEIYSLPYSYRIALNFDPSAGIKMVFADYLVTIEGQNLHELAKWLHERRVESITATDDRYSSLTSPVGTAVVVTEIVVSERE